MSMRNNKQGKNMKVKATSYTGKQLTYLGTQARYGVIATDPKVIPLGSKVYIPYFDKVFIAEDTGSADPQEIKPNTTAMVDSIAQKAKEAAKTASEADLNTAYTYIHDTYTDFSSTMKLWNK